MQQEAAAGRWPNRVLLDYFDVTVRDHPWDLALVAYRMEDGTRSDFSYAELDELVDLISANLSRLGVSRGDTVSYQLPNWWESVAIHLACLRVGAVSNPLMPIFRERELQFMLNNAESKVLIVPKSFRKFDHEGLAAGLQKSFPLLHVLVIGGKGDHSFETALLGSCGQTPHEEECRIRPNDVMKLMYTSGTTGEPKGVLHTSNTLLSSLHRVSERLNLGGRDVLFMPSPFAHSIGFCYGMMMSIYLGRPLITMDIWDREKAVDIIEEHRVTYTFGATPFLSDLIDVAGIDKRDIENFRLFMTAGAPVPPSLVESATTTLNADVICGWGMTETGLVTTTLPAEMQAGLGTDGIALPDHEIRIAGAGNSGLPAGEAGELLCRGPTTFIGYFKRPDLYAVDAHGWFDTGDVARMNERGYINIVGRSKDIIIRGGENIPVVEVEKLMFEMPQIREVALVAMPDPRLGEKGCAFVTLHEGCTLTLEELTDFLEEKKLARQYMPERLEILDKMLITPSGKIQKYALREIVNQRVTH